MSHLPRSEDEWRRADDEAPLRDRLRPLIVGAPDAGIVRHRHNRHRFGLLGGGVTG